MEGLIFSLAINTFDAIDNPIECKVLLFSIPVAILYLMEKANEFKKILAAVDGSAQSMRAVDVCISLASKYNSVLTALYVIHIPFGESLYPRSVWYKDFINDVNKEIRGWFAEIQKRGKENGVIIESKTRETGESIPAGLIRYAEEDGTDLIVVGSKGKSELEKLFIGSVAFGILGHAPCPVLVVR